jgi:hypothetical protein
VYGPTFGAPFAYCTAGVSTGGCTPLVAWSGTASASSATPFAILVAPIDGQRNGLLFYGLDAASPPNPWGAGSSSFLCVKAPTQRTPLQSSGGTAGACDGSLALDWNAFLASNGAALGSPFAAFDRVRAQAWFRDPAAVKGTNLSNALDFPLAP